MEHNIIVKQEFDAESVSSIGLSTHAEKVKLEDETEENLVIPKDEVEYNEHMDFGAYASDVGGVSTMIKNETLDIKASPEHDDYEDSYSIETENGQQQVTDEDFTASGKFENETKKIGVTPNQEVDELKNHCAYDGRVTEEGFTIKSETLDIPESSGHNHVEEPHSTRNRQQQLPAQLFSWDKQTTQLLVERYMHLKDAFRDPKIKKKKLWDEIKQTFVSKGHNVTEEILDRKWRNMKKTYTGIKDNIRKTGRGKIYWEYYHQFDGIYVEDKTVNSPRALSTAPVSVIQKKARINTDPIEEPAGIIEEPQPSTSATPQIQKQKDDITLTPKSTKMDSNSGLFYLKKKLAEIETARVNEIQLLREALEKNNEIQERRNEILQNLCDSLKKT